MMTPSPSQWVADTLGGLYSRYGYTQFKMSKFEEYDLYARNKDFLISEQVITFTDVSGKLMALKPDVTLSIVKNCKAAPTVQKLYYNENVYRVTKGAMGFREIRQMGLECLGPIDGYCISEVLLLAAKSLTAISRDAVLDISHLGLLEELLESLRFPAEHRPALLKAIGEKSPHELTAVCGAAGMSAEDTALLQKLIATAGAPDKVLPRLEDLLRGKVRPERLDRFREVIGSLLQSSIAPAIRLDFSVVDDIHYYNGFVFKGFVSGLPGSVLSGGQYDKLVKKLGRTDRAIGFAVYLDMLEHLQTAAQENDVDTLLIYEEDTPLATVRAAAKKLAADGSRVMVQRAVPEDLRCGKIIHIREVADHADA